MGTDYQTNDAAVDPAFIGTPNFGYNISFPRAFKSMPVVIANCYDPSGPQFHTYIGTHTLAYFAFWGTSLGGNISAATRVKWVAFVP
jgi:hypothetical protein